jgi:hypothetical protein
VGKGKGEKARGDKEKQGYDISSTSNNKLTLAHNNDADY